VLQLLLVVLVYRVVMAALGALLTSRKGRDLGILLVALTGLSGVGVNYAVHSIGPALAQGRTPALAVVVKALPSGWGTVAVRAAGDGRWIRVVLLGAGMVVLLGLLTLAWAALLARRATSAQFRGAARVRASDGGIRRWSPLPRSPVGAVAGKELRTWWRDARRRVALLSALLTGLIMAVGPGLATGGGHQATLPFIGLWVVFFSCAQTGNLYGLDGSALWHTLVVPGAERADVRGRQLAWALIVGPLGLLCCLVLPGAVGRPQTYPWVLSLFLATFGAGAGALVLQAAFVPFPLPDQRTRSSPFSSGGRPGCTRAVQLLGILLLLVVAAVPVVVLEVVGVVARLPALQWAGLPLGLATGALLAWWWGRLAQDRLVLRGPEILATVSKEA
jgi:ABC-2 type transport system permease protein